MRQTILAQTLFNGDKFRNINESRVHTCNGEPHVGNDVITVYTKGGLRFQYKLDGVVEVLGEQVR